MDTRPSIGAAVTLPGQVSRQSEPCLLREAGSAKNDPDLQQCRLQSTFCGEMSVRVAYEDEPATLATWHRNALQIAEKERIDPLRAHLMLMRWAPLAYGMPIKRSDCDGVRR